MENLAHIHTALAYEQTLRPEYKYRQLPVHNRQPRVYFSQNWFIFKLRPTKDGQTVIAFFFDLRAYLFREETWKR